jgi:hypothetical protein
MANIILLTVTLAVEGFLLYVLLQFARELRRNRAARRQTTIVWSLDALRRNASSSRQAVKVIPIPMLSRRSSASPFAGRVDAGHILGGKQWG